MGCGTLAALALTGAGTGAGMYAAQKERNAQNAAVGAELQRQKQFGQQTQGVFQKSLAQSTPQAFQAQQQAGAQKALAATPQLTGLGQAPSTSTVGQDVKNVKQQQASAQQFGLSNQAMAQYLKDLEANTQLGVLSNMAGQSQQVLPIELQGAGQSYGKLGALGSLLGTAGQLVGVGSAVARPKPGLGAVPGSPLSVPLTQGADLYPWMTSYPGTFLV